MPFRRHRKSAALDGTPSGVAPGGVPVSGDTVVIIGQLGRARAHGEGYPDLASRRGRRHAVGRSRGAHGVHDPVADLAALVAGQQVSTIACERPGSAQVFYARTLDELREWAEEARNGRL
jgi:hypothetical protein